MTLTILIQADQLCGEFKNLVHQCLALKPTYLVVNSLNNDLIEYFIAHFKNEQLTCFVYRDLYHLYRQIQKTYQTDRYLCLDSLDPILTRQFLSNFMKEVDSSGRVHGNLVNPLHRDDLVSKNKLTHTVSQINRHVFYQNRKSSDNGYHYVSTDHNLEHQPVLKLVNRTVLITGALGGIGLATARHYQNEGYSVIGIDRLSREETPKNKLRYLSHYYQLDLSHARISDRIKEILSRVRRIDVLVHIAGYQTCDPIRDVHSTGKDWDRVMNVNVRSIYTLTKYCFNHLRKTLGSVVVVSSVHAIASSRDISLYAISKSALLGLVRNFAIEWGQYGIRINGLAPGAIDTPMLQAGLSRRGNPDEVMEELRDRHLMGDIGHPNQMASSIFFLGDSDQSGFMTGQTVVMDGGASIFLSTEVS